MGRWTFVPPCPDWLIAYIYELFNSTLIQNIFFEFYIFFFKFLIFFV